MRLQRQENLPATGEISGWTGPDFGRISSILPIQMQLAGYHRAQGLAGTSN